jgi:prepilin-type N-terminal cleavage/methylation domain-containing protein
MEALCRALRRILAPGPSSDAGFTLVEVIVATVCICIVMAALTSFFVTTVRVNNLSGGQATAVELASEAVELARATPVDDLRAAVANPGGRWIPVTAAGAANPEQPFRNDIQFARAWSVTTCWQPPAGGTCAAQSAGYLPYLLVGVTVTWRDDRCVQAQCSFTTSTLLSNALRDPVFTS